MDAIDNVKSLDEPTPVIGGRPVGYRLTPEHEILPVTTWREMGEMWADGARRVARDIVNGAEVSTVFLVIDHAFFDGPPILFETMVFGGPHAEAMWRYATWDEAAAGHAAVVQALRDGRDPETVL